jgi:rhodanese-related sulfurtransferase
MKNRILLPVLIMLSISFASLEAQNKIEVNSKQVSTILQKNKKMLVLDVRTADEFNEGHIKGAINIDIRQDNAFGRIDKLDRKAGYLVYCRTNHRSGIAVEHMLQNGFKTVYQMMDGFPGWVANNLPVEK